MQYYNDKISTMLKWFVTRKRSTKPKQVWPLMTKTKIMKQRLANTIESFYLSNSNNKVEGLVIFQRYFSRHHILVAASAEDYLNGVFTTRRAIIAYTQNIMMWLTMVRFQLIAFFHHINWINVLTANPLMAFDRQDILAEAITALLFMAAYFGKFNLINYSLYGW